MPEDRKTLYCCFTLYLFAGHKFKLFRIKSVFDGYFNFAFLFLQKKSIHMLNLYKQFFSFFLACSLPLFTLAQIYERTDTLFIPEITNAPVIDGNASDEAWEAAEWKTIGEIWMPYNNESTNLGQESGLQLWEDENDFKGRYKAVWSSQTNLLYFVAEITDDVFVDGYVYNENPSSGGGYPNYDILEIFIDEDRSGGLHVFDGTGSVATNWGSNAENAFSYHLAVDAPDNGEVQNQFHALDIAGTNWGYPSHKVADYAGHFPEFSMKREDNTYRWEFSLRVHGSTYNPSNPEASVAALGNGKIMGLSLAYCDNDNPGESPLKRDHFFGSVYVPLSAYNDHWKNANWFGVAKLTENQVTSFSRFQLEELIKVNCSAAKRLLNVSVSSATTGKVNIRVMNIAGKEMLRDTKYKDASIWSSRFDLTGWQNGIYLAEIIHHNKRVVTKIIVK
jgi:hypothetical protein